VRSAQLFFAVCSNQLMAAAVELKQCFVKEVSMKLAYTSLIIATSFATASLSSLAAEQADTARNAATSAAEEQSQVKTSDTGWAVPQSVQLDPQIVQSYGGSLRPGPHNRQRGQPHGGAVVSMARSTDVPGRE
jgi:hypothetical protein